MRGRYSTGLRGGHWSGDGPAAGAQAQRRAWLAVALWVALIFVASLDTFSASATRGPLAAFLQFLGLGTEVIDWIHVFVRKGAHLALYGGLGLLAARAAGLSFAAPRVLPAAFSLALVVAAGDEAHQATTPSRTGSPRDVALDFAGAAIGALLWRQRSVFGVGPGRDSLSGFQQEEP